MARRNTMKIFSVMAGMVMLLGAASIAWGGGPECASGTPALQGPATIASVQFTGTELKYLARCAGETNNGSISYPFVPTKDLLECVVIDNIDQLLPKCYASGSGMPVTGYIMAVTNYSSTGDPTSPTSATADVIMLQGK